MNKFLIKDVEALTGIKAHTLRVWETRYNLFLPKRTETNIRFYDDEDLKLLLNVSILNEQGGKKISEIAKYSIQEIADMAASYFEDCSRFGCQIQSLCDSMLRLDESLFDKTLSTNILKHGFEDAMNFVVFPFLQKIGLMWQTGSINPAHEHFISHLVRQKLMVAIDAIHLTPSANSKRFMLFLPEGESHDIMLLYAKYLLKARNHQVLYLGQNLPISDLKATIDYYQPFAVVTILTSMNFSASVEPIIEKIMTEIKGYPLIVGGRMVAHLQSKCPMALNVVHSPQDFIEKIGKLSAQKAVI